MNTGHYLTKINRVEMRVYELMGIRLFRKVILLVERIKHRKRGGQNENYHPADMTVSTLRRFSGYLLYNATLHLISLLFAAIYFAVTRAFALSNVVTDIVMAVVVVLNGYCLMLQRYVCLRFRQHIAKKQHILLAVRADRIADIAKRLTDKTPDELHQEAALLQSIQRHILSGTDMCLTETDATVLHRIHRVLPPSTQRKQTKRKPKQTFGELMDALPKTATVFSHKQRWISVWQSALRWKKQDTMLFGVCLITVNADVEAAYTSVFPHPSLDEVLDTIDVLLGAYDLHRKEAVRL